MRHRLLLLALVAGCSLVAVGGAYASVRHSQREAEINLLHAPKAMGRLNTRLIDPRTGWFRNGTTAVCHGRGRSRGSEWPRFVCTVSAAKATVSVLYFAQRHNGFEIRRLRVSR
jgi:hypothetical protein